jgi:hypothetical protein
MRHAHDVALAGQRIVLGALDRGAQRAVPAGDDPLHEIGLDPEGRRRLARIEHAETAARAGADVSQAAGVAERRGDRIRRALYRWERSAHRGGDGQVLVVHELEDLAARHRREAGGLRVARLGPW